MKVLVLNDGNLVEKEIENKLEVLQKIVGGYIEIPFLSKDFFENEIDIIINEEGKFIEGLRPEITVLKDGTNQILDIVYGNCIFASHDTEGNTIGLNTEQIKLVKNVLKTEVGLSTKDGNIFLTKALFI